MSSTGSRVILRLMRLLNYKQKLLKKMESGVDKSKPCPTPPEKMYEKFKIDAREMCGCPVYSVSPKANQANVNILFFHGGSYVGNFNKRHWRLIAELVKETGVVITAVDYPLAPQFNHSCIFDKITQIYSQWVKEANGAAVLLMGDSAGGGMAAALNMWAALNNAPRPDGLILISPWVDLTMENTEIPSLQKSDPFISAEALKLCAESYAGGADKKLYTLSPLYGDLSLLSKVHLFTGTRDILYPDIVKFCAKLSGSNVDTNENIYQDMLHDFVLFNFAEAKQAKAQIAAVVNSYSGKPA